MYPLFFIIKYSQIQATCRCTEETWVGEDRVGVICESDLRMNLLIAIACSNAVGEIAFMAMKT